MMVAARFGMLTVFLALGMAQGSMPSVQATIRLDAKAEKFEHNWEKIVGSGSPTPVVSRGEGRWTITMAHRPDDGHRTAPLARDELGMQGIRGHGLLDDDMSVLPRANQPPEFYNVDQVLDYLVELGMKPVVELSFMPKALVSCGGAKQPACNYAFGDPGGYKGLQMPPDDFGKWSELIGALAEHLVERYGLDEVASWHFEVWNEMWGMSFPHPYLELYNASAVALKSVSPRLRVGGPATMQTLNVGDFIRDAAAAHIPVDFVSTHFYPTDPQCQTNATKAAIDCFAHTTQAAQRLAAAADLPFLLTEYNNGLGSTSRDDSSAAAFAFRQMGLVQAFEVFSWWTFSDVFEEGWPVMRSAPFHNGYGMMTMQGTRKPVWRAFEALHAAGTERYPAAFDASTPADTISILATGPSADPAFQGSGLGQLYVANWHRVDAERFGCDEKAKTCTPQADGPYTDQALCDANCGGGADGVGVPLSTAGAATASPGVAADPFARKLVVHVTLPTAEGATTATVPATVTAYRIDEAHANPQGLWKSWGSPQYVNATQIAALDKASEVVAETLRTSTSRTGVGFSIELELPEYSAVHVVM